MRPRGCGSEAQVGVTTLRNPFLAKLRRFKGHRGVPRAPARLTARLSGWPWSRARAVGRPSRYVRGVRCWAANTRQAVARIHFITCVCVCRVWGGVVTVGGGVVAAACVYASSLTRYPRVTTVGIRMALPTTEHVCTCHVTLPPRALADVLPSLPPAPLLPRCYAAAVPRCRSAAFCPAAKTNTCAWGPRGPHPRKAAWPL